MSAPKTSSKPFWMMIDRPKVTRMTSSTFSPTTRCSRKRCRPKPNAKGDRQDDERRDDRIEAERCRQRQQDEAGQDDEIAVGDIDEAHDAGRERQAGREQRVKAAEQDALQELIDPDRGHRLSQSEIMLHHDLAVDVSAGRPASETLPSSRQ